MLFHPFTHDGRIFTKLQKRGVICAAKPERRVANEGVWVWWELVRGLGRRREWERRGKRKSDGKGRDFRKRGDGKKKVERLLLVRAEFRIISGKSHSIYLQVAPLSSLSLPLCLHPPSFCMLSVLFSPKPDKLPSSYFIIHYLPFLFGILKYVISFLCISLTICPAPYCAGGIRFKGHIWERLIFFITVREINPSLQCMQTSMSPYSYMTGNTGSIFFTQQVIFPLFYMTLTDIW